MKKIIFLFFVAGMFSLISCGPSAEELKALEQARLDSIAKVEADSLAALAEQARLDSIALADSLEQVRINDSIAAANKPKGNKKPKTPETTKPTGPSTGLGGRKVEPTEAPKTGKEGRK